MILLDEMGSQHADSAMDRSAHFRPRVLPEGGGERSLPAAGHRDRRRYPSQGVRGYPDANE